MISNSITPAVLTLTASLESTSLTIDSQFTPAVLRITAAGPNGLSPTLGWLWVTVTRYIKDPIRTGGCVQCGTFLYLEGGRPIRGTVVKTGRNFDIDKGRREDRYIRCGRCGWINHRDRSSHLGEGSKAGWGLKYDEVEAGESDISYP